MLGITCSKCSRRFTPGTEDLQGYLAQSEGKKYALVLCPHCNYGNKIPVPRLQQAVRAATAGQPQAGAPQPGAPEAPGASAGEAPATEAPAE